MADTHHIIATLDDGKLHPIFSSDTTIWLGKVASVGLKVPFYIAINLVNWDIELEEDSPLWLLGTTLNGEIVLGKTYSDILKGGGRFGTSDKEKMIIPLCFYADLEGEYICKLRIGSITYNLGIEAVGENEMLKINLANKGVEIPNGVIRAIYETNPEQSNPDYAILNKKWKELLINYMELMGGKGNCKQLVNALEWFEYGDKIELREVWKVDTMDGARYFDRKFTPIVDDEVRELMKNAAKTTYLTIRHIPNSNHDKYPEQTFMTRFDESYNWSKEIMRTKMCLLGNFYETFFLPIHMNVLHSVVEDIYRGYFAKGTELKESHATLIENVYSPYKMVNLGIEATDFKELEGFYDLVDGDVPFGGLYNDKILAFVDGSNVGEAESLENLIYLYHGPGSVVHAKVTIPERYNDGDLFSDATIKLVTNITGEEVTTYHTTTKGGNIFEFDLVAQMTGTYTVYLEISSNKTDKEERVYVASGTIEIPDTSQIDIQFYKFLYSPELFREQMPSLMVMSAEDIEKLWNGEDIPEIVETYMETYDAFDFHQSQDQLITSRPDASINLYTYYKHAKFTGELSYNEMGTGICKVMNFVLAEDGDDMSGYNDTYHSMGSSKAYWMKYEERLWSPDDSTTPILRKILTFIFNPCTTLSDATTEVNKYGLGASNYSLKYMLIPSVHELVEVANSEKIDVTKYILIASPVVTFEDSETGKQESILIYSNEMQEKSSWVFKDATGNIIQTLPYIRNPFIPIEVLGKLTVEFNWSWSDVIRTVSTRSPLLYIPT